MRAIIDIKWADLIIPFVNCTYCSDLLKYNSSRSATYKPNGTELVIGIGGFGGQGFVSRDTLTIGDGVHVLRHPFLEANQTTTSFPGADTVFGLAIDQPAYIEPSEHFLPSPFATLIEQNALDRNIVSILLPKNDDDLGDIWFGNIDDSLYEGEFSTHPLYPPGTTQWQIEARSAKVSDSNGSMLLKNQLQTTQLSYIPTFHTPFFLRP